MGNLTHSLPPKFIYPSSEAELKLKEFTYDTRLSPQSVTGMGGSAMLTCQRVSGSECVNLFISLFSTAVCYFVLLIFVSDLIKIMMDNIEDQGLQKMRWPHRKLLGMMRTTFAQFFILFKICSEVVI